MLQLSFYDFAAPALANISSEKSLQAHCNRGFEGFFIQSVGLIYPLLSYWDSPFLDLFSRQSQLPAHFMLVPAYLHKSCCIIKLGSLPVLNPVSQDDGVAAMLFANIVD